MIPKRAPYRGNEKTERNRQIATLIAAGIPTAEVMATYGLTRQRVLYIARQHGVRQRDWGPGKPKANGGQSDEAQA